MQHLKALPSRTSTASQIQTLQEDSSTAVDFSQPTPSHPQITSPADLGNPSSPAYDPESATVREDNDFSMPDAQTLSEPLNNGNDGVDASGVAVDAANVLAEALSSRSYDNTVADPRVSKY